MNLGLVSIQISCRLFSLMDQYRAVCCVVKLKINEVELDRIVKRARRGLDTNRMLLRFKTEN